MGKFVRGLIILASLVLMAAVTLLPAMAASGGSITYLGTGSNPGGDCNLIFLDYEFSLTGDTDDDGIGNDYFAVLMVDGNGVVLDNDYWSTTFVPTTASDFSDFGAVNTITARPVTFSLVDIGDPGLLDENSPAGVAFTQAGTVLASFVVDPGTQSFDDGSCAALPLAGATASAGCTLPVPSGSVVGEAPLGAQAYYRPGDVAPGIVLNPGTYIVVGVDSTDTYYKVVLACQFLWVRKDAMQPSFQAPQNGAPLPTRVVS